MGTVVYLVCIVVASFAILAQPVVAQGASTTPPLTYHSQVLQSVDNQTCPSEEHQEIARNEIKTATCCLLQTLIIPDLQSYSFVCGRSTGWKRVAYLNMSDPSQQCPSVWQEITTPFRVCRRRSVRCSCEGPTYTTGSILIRMVPSRHHIWNFVAAYVEGFCPCGNNNRRVWSHIVGQNYFCESGLTHLNSTGRGIFWPNGDPLWDGQGCGPTNPVAPSTHHHGSM